ncbi:hypothetical protein BU24DRAFT_266654 [Aaosphaeria arxii CBS 175.79]|uniref:Uncharacterized protein n=1 Tax=Aaosphaeria arxii CBS 175.79 TaxID=1450172 RepID=A0A6A5XFS0_9PLEO|nr:uncharacterized protein BU24DRAFT_266654 [Aaosphaeria arxii CBS 175.79]KAF2011932.1 hypothetical protein BU24DRAFT_266654 [Aaosphaeria arxii CBS 175.79]
MYCHRRRPRPCPRCYSSLYFRLKPELYILHHTDAAYINPLPRTIRNAHINSTQDRPSPAWKNSRRIRLCSIWRTWYVLIFIYIDFSPLPSIPGLLGGLYCETWPTVGETRD